MDVRTISTILTSNSTYMQKHQDANVKNKDCLDCFVYQLLLHPLDSSSVVFQVHSLQRSFRYLNSLTSSEFNEKLCTAAHFQNHNAISNLFLKTKRRKTKLHGFSPQANYTDRIGEVSANFCGQRVSRGQRNGSPRPLISVF
jgi:hypothetical protein